MEQTEPWNNFHCHAMSKENFPSSIDHRKAGLTLLQLGEPTTAYVAGLYLLKVFAT